MGSWRISRDFCSSIRITAILVFAMMCLFRQTGDETAAVFCQPCPMRPVVWKKSFHIQPESCGVVHMTAVAQFVHHHILRHFRGDKRQQRIETQVAPGAAASPAGALGADGVEP